VTYIWQKADWPRFTWDTEAVDQYAYTYALEASSLVGEVKHLSKAEKSDALIDLMVSEAVKTSQIEGEKFDREDVRSSIRNQLGLSATPENVRDPNANGVAALMISVRDHFAEPLTAERLCQWQDKIIVGRFERGKIDVGKWRTHPEPMQIVSGAYGKEKVHFEAPPSSQVPAEMIRFIAWFNGSQNMKGAARAGVAHLYFECIHPFSDGNGRVGRAISEIALSQELGHPVLMSLSTTIQERQQEYYDVLSRASLGGLDITEWLVWFTGLVLDSQRQAKEQIAYVISKARFWDAHADTLNARQSKVLSRMFREGPDGFKGGMSAQKYTKMTDCSKATATRDLAELLKMGAIRKLEGGGRSTRYDIQLPEG
jgi:Fic family protein|tara:strand:- start:17 stop:1126 length:1110 start_codon:yes stop_codon:yes gene_type:complete